MYTFTTFWAILEAPNPYLHPYPESQWVTCISRPLSLFFHHLTPPVGGHYKFLKERFLKERPTPILTLNPYPQSLPSIITPNPYPQSLPSILTLNPNPQSLPSRLTLNHYPKFFTSIFFHNTCSKYLFSILTLNPNF